MSGLVQRVWRNVIFGLFVWLQLLGWTARAEDEAVRQWAEAQLVVLQKEFIEVGWERATIGTLKIARQSERQIYPTGLGVAWWAEVRVNDQTAGYLLGEAAPPHRLLEFGQELRGWPFGGKEKERLLSGVPNLQQFAVRGISAKQVASGCVPTAGANVLGYWANQGYPTLIDRDEDGGALRRVTERLRARLSIQEFPDEAGYTLNGMPLAGALPEELVQAIQAEALERSVPLKPKLEAFSALRFQEEIAAGRPVLLSCVVRLPQAPHLSWGHEVVGIGWRSIAGHLMVAIRDNFYPTLQPEAVRWIAAESFTQMISVRLEFDRE